MATHYVARELLALGHDVRQVPPAYAKPFRQGHKNDFRDAYALAGPTDRQSLLERSVSMAAARLPQLRSTHGPDTEVQDQSLHRSHRACNTRPDFGCDPDGSLIGNFVPSIQYTAPKEVFFAEPPTLSFISSTSALSGISRARSDLPRPRLCRSHRSPRGKPCSTAWISASRWRARPLRRIAPIETACACFKSVESVYSGYADLPRAS